MSVFYFESYEFDGKEAFFRYRDYSRAYEERVSFRNPRHDYDKDLLDRALFLSFILIGTSYYKLFPTREVVFREGGIDSWQAEFLNYVYQEGLSQFAYENNLTRSDLAHFSATDSEERGALKYDGRGVLVLASGGKDSLLTAAILEEKNKDFDSYYISSSDYYPSVLDDINGELFVSKRQIDIEGIKSSIAVGGKNGHVPVTYIVQSLALVQAILLGNNTVLSSIAREGEEAHAWIDDLPINHQWSKTWKAEQLFVQYVQRYISADIRIGSALRGYSELRVAEMFVDYAWQKYGTKFSSCNRANYEQGSDNRLLSWCGSCPKCANSYLLFAPFMPEPQLRRIFKGKDLFADSSMQKIFKGLLGVDSIMKPFECIGEIDELRKAYHMAELRGYSRLPFTVPDSEFDKDSVTATQVELTKMLL
ncbi:hypothetical protein H6796_00535 [Candidatus Nomurabacteria bacterium]|nr:hypothetical protein [Candidatus Nomurabacteria bacterium]